MFLLLVWFCYVVSNVVAVLLLLLLLFVLFTEKEDLGLLSPKCAFSDYYSPSPSNVVLQASEGAVAAYPSLFKRKASKTDSASSTNAGGVFSKASV